MPSILLRLLQLPLAFAARPSESLQPLQVTPVTPVTPAQPEGVRTAPQAPDGASEPEPKPFAGFRDPGGCAEAMTSVTSPACSVSVFVQMASSVASSLDCEFLRTNNLLKIFAKLFERADRAGLKSMKSREPKRFEELEACDGGVRYASYNTKKLVLFPYGSYEPAVGDGEPQQPAVDEGLRFAQLGGGVDDFAKSSQVLFTPQLHTRLQYFGNDPAILMHLWGTQAGTPGQEPKNWSACDPSDEGPGRGLGKGPGKGGPHNLIDPVLFQSAFDPTKHPDSEAHELVHWSPAAESRTTQALISEASSVAFKTTDGGKAVPMGTITMTVNMTYAGEVLSDLPLSTHAYAMVADAEGKVVAMSRRAREMIFKEGLSEQAMRNPRNEVACRGEQRTDCWWSPPVPLSLQNASQDEFSGINFQRMLDVVFNESLAGEHLCSMGVRSMTFEVPRTGEHLAVYCRLMANPEWAIFLFAPVEELQTAASFSVDKTNITGQIGKGKSEEDVHQHSILLQNTGRVELPFLVTVSPGKGDNSSCITVTPANGTLSPNATVNLTLSFDLNAFGYGTSSGWLIVHPDTSEDTGACFRKSTWTRFSLTRLKLQGFFKDVMKRNSIPLSVALLVALMMVLFRVVSSLLNSYYGKLAQERSTIEKALQATQEVSFPMVLLQVPIFKKLGEFVSFEKTLHESLWLHTIQEIDNFLQRAQNKVIFMSHQWTAFDEPDHTREQYRQMLMAVEEVMKKWSWEEIRTYVWLDYSSIPQRHRPSQTAAINSLTVYAAKVSAFVVVAPPVKHKDLKEQDVPVECNKDTYQTRAWCRAEQLSHLLAQAGDNMFLAENGQLTPLDEAWLQKSIQVFGDSQLTCCRRKHEGMDTCDRERLVVPMLGLWAQLCRSVKSGDANENLKKIHQDLTDTTSETGPRIKQIFPETFIFETEDGQEERSLFGQLVERLQDTLSQEPVGPKRQEKRNLKALATATVFAQRGAAGAGGSTPGKRLSHALAA